MRRPPTKCVFIVHTKNTHTCRSQFWTTFTYTLQNLFINNNQNWIWMHNMHLFYQHNTVCLECFRRVSECTDRSIVHSFVWSVNRSFAGCSLGSTWSVCVCERVLCGGRSTNHQLVCTLCRRWSWFCSSHDFFCCS